MSDFVLSVVLALRVASPVSAAMVLLVSAGRQFVERGCRPKCCVCDGKDVFKTENRESPMNDRRSEILDTMRYFRDIPAPLPGPQKIDLSFSTDFRDYDDSPQSCVPRRIHTDVLDVLGIDIVLLTYENLEHTRLDAWNAESFLRKSEYISPEFFRKREHRSEVLAGRKKKGLHSGHGSRRGPTSRDAGCVESLESRATTAAARRHCISPASGGVVLLSFEGDVPDAEGLPAVSSEGICSGGSNYTASEVDVGDLLVVDVGDADATFREIQHHFRLRRKHEEH